ncbi:MAG: PepSY domain-containing protein [Nitrosomonas sp. PRO4]|nr:PepSY domain-containing protein [Nitrosomonas sp. PRO4]
MQTKFYITKILVIVSFTAALFFASVSFAGLLDKKVELSTLPPKVQETIKLNAQGGTIKSIEQEKEKREVTIYEVEVKKPDGTEIEFKVDENGSLIELEKN